jgi:2-iminobutanoate/2-iminopropanoate deaminase
VTDIRAVETQQAPTPKGHYSQGIVHGGVVYVAGQLPLDPATGEPTGGDAAAQAERTLRNVEAVLEAAGSSLSKLLSVTVYVTDMALWGEVNRAYGTVLGHHRPARAIVPVKELRAGCVIEIQAIAAL